MFDIQSFYEAKSVRDAVEALMRDENAEVISGGTDVLIRVREGKDAGRSLVSIHNIKELKGVTLREDGTIDKRAPEYAGRGGGSGGRTTNPECGHSGRKYM